LSHADSDSAAAAANRIVLIADISFSSFKLCRNKERTYLSLFVESPPMT
jgi:hypothetical protein